MNKLPPLAALLAGVCLHPSLQAAAQPMEDRPNFLVVITDDQSAAHTSFAGDPVVRTPGFDRIAANGAYFPNSYCSAPSCSPSRAAMLTGRQFYELGPGSVLFSAFPGDVPTYQDLLREAGYFTGYTGKAWGPGFWGTDGREVDPAGLAYQSVQVEDAPEELGKWDYAENFKAFLEDRDGRPFSFIFGSSEPHLPYLAGRGEANGLDASAVSVPPFLPDTPGVRTQLLDYYDEIQWMDAHLVEMLDHLESLGELDNTVVIFTSDNGMPFPRAKSDLYDPGVRLPFAVMWPREAKPGRTVTDFVQMADIAPTLLELAGVDEPPSMSGRSFADVLRSPDSGRIDATRDAAVVGLERHDKPSPMRAIHTDRYILIRNDYQRRAPLDGWPWTVPVPPAQQHEELWETALSYHLLATLREDPRVSAFTERAYGSRPPVELYDRQEDPWQLNNLAEDSALADVRQQLSDRLDDYLRKTGDPRALGQPNFDQYPHYGGKSLTPEQRQAYYSHQNQSNRRLKAYYKEHPAPAQP